MKTIFKVGHCVLPRFLLDNQSFINMFAVHWTQNFGCADVNLIEFACTIKPVFNKLRIIKT